MKFYLAPMEGITGYIVRNAFYHNFHYIDKYFTPFIPAAKRMNKKILRDIDPENNRGMKLIPQLMSNRADEVISIGRNLREYGYDSLNINLGCPSGTVVSKKRGSGLLLYPEELDLFLDELYSKTDMRISIKTRIGFDSPQEWPRLLEIYRKYPIEELIIHPRIQKDFYKNAPRPDAFALAADVLADTGIVLCYNGDITDEESYRAIADRFPNLDRVMIGRGLLAKPYLAEVLSASVPRPAELQPASVPGFVEHQSASVPGFVEHQPAPVPGAVELSDPVTGKSDELKRHIRAFHDEIFDGYSSIFSGERDAMFHMKEIWAYLGNSFVDSEKYMKKIRKAQSFAEYRVIVDAVFRELEVSI